jgi:hypothetical protein
MLVTVKPDDPNFVLVGGTNLYRSTDGFATNTRTAWINGYAPDFSYQHYPNGHADQHSFTFTPQTLTRPSVEMTVAYALAAISRQTMFPGVHCPTTKRSNITMCP